MKKLLLLCLLGSVQFCTAQNITIKFDKDVAEGTKGLTGYDFENYLMQNLITYKIDTLKAVNGKISIPNKTTDITPFVLARNKPRQIINIFVEPKKDFILTMSEPVFGIKSVTGSHAQQEYIDFLKKQQVLEKQNQAIQKQFATSKNQDSLRNVIKYIQMQMNAQYIEFINFEKDNGLGAFMVLDVANKNKGIGGSELESLYNKLDAKGKATIIGKNVGRLVTRLKSMEVGNAAPDFTLKDKDGKKHKLSSLKGKYVLLDFWASWCGPCIKEIPHLKTAYAKYKTKDFEIMSVSIDRNPAKWLTAVKKYQMPWLSVIDAPYAKDKITQNLYHVPTIPKTLLLNKEGVVIGKDFRGPALEHKLAELLK